MDREEGDHADGAVLREADEDVGGGLRRRVDAEPEPGLDAVTRQGGEARAAGAERLLDPVDAVLAGEREAEHHTDQRPDDRVDRVPGRIQEGHLVGRELDHEHPRRGEQDPVLIEPFRNPADPGAAEQAEHQHGRIGVDPRRPPGAEDGGRDVHAPTLITPAE